MERWNFFFSRNKSKEMSSQKCISRYEIFYMIVKDNILFSRKYNTTFWSKNET